MNNLDKIVYQIYPKSFMDTNNDGIGDINGIIRKLDYLKSLEIDYLWISPICKSPQKDNGYDISDYYTIDPLFGTNEDYQKLIKEANNRGIKVVMDLVLNHVSDQHEWFKKALEKDEKYMDYFIWSDKPNELISAFKKPAWTYAKEVDKYYLHLFDSSQPDLNWNNPSMRKDLYKMINYWIENGVEGFRLDVIDLIGKDPINLIKAKGPNFEIYLKELCGETFKDKIFTVGECWNSSIDDLNKMCGQNGLNQAFHFNHLLTTKGKNKWDHGKIDINKLAPVIEHFQNNYDGEEALVMNNHDLPRLNSFWLNDQEYVSESSKLLVSLFGLLKGTMYIYQGEEIGMTNAHFDKIDDYRDVETLNKFEADDSFEKSIEIIKRISRDNARTPMQWSNSKNAGFSSHNPWININKNYKFINVEDQITNEDSVLSYYKKIIRFRKDNQHLINCDVNVYTHGGLLIIKKSSGLTGIYNFSEKTVKYEHKSNVIFDNYNVTKSNVFSPFQVKIIKEDDV